MKKTGTKKSTRVSAHRKVSAVTTPVKSEADNESGERVWPIIDVQWNCHRYMGIALAGGKSKKTCLAILDFFPKEGKVFLRHLVLQIKSEKERSADQILIEEIGRRGKNLKIIGLNAPLGWPKCVRCELDCPGYEVCTETEILWLWKNYRKRNKVKRPSKLFTPYTERCAEVYIGQNLEEVFSPSHALGANSAPLTARAHFLARRLDNKLVEVYPKLSLWRLGRSLKMGVRSLRCTKYSVQGEPLRKSFLKRLTQTREIFIYEQDRILLEENAEVFDAFLCAYTAFLKGQKKCENRPKNFPGDESWIEIPEKDF